MSSFAIGDDELLSYVLEVDMEDAVNRVILTALDATGPSGIIKLINLLRGKKPYMWRGKKDLYPYFGRLQQFSQDQVYDFIEGLKRFGHINSTETYRRHYRIVISEVGMKGIKSKKLIKAQIPWPLPCKEFPEEKPEGLFQKGTELGRLVEGQIFGGI